MARPKRSYLQAIHHQVLSWANWNAMYLDNAGYPHSTVEARLMEGGAGDPPPPGCRIPMGIMMPAHVQEIDRAVRVMPKDLHQVIMIHYVDGNRVSRQRVTEALQWLAGRLGK